MMQEPPQSQVPDARSIALGLASKYTPVVIKTIGGNIARSYGGEIGGLVFDAVADYAIGELQKKYA